jgi:hypothetical protein
VRLEGTGSNHDAVGANVSITVAGQRRLAQRVGGGSFQSASDPRLHFGVGQADRVESIDVVWPSGRTSQFRDLKTDSGYLLREGTDLPIPLEAFKKPRS